MNTNKSTDVRAAFELWYVGHTFNKTPPEIERNAQGYYILMQTRSSWDAYHAGWLDHTAAVAQQRSDYVS